MSSSVRTRDGAFSVAASIQAQDSSRSKREMIDFSAVLEWAKRNGVKVRRSDRALEAVNSVRALNGLPRFVLKTPTSPIKLPEKRQQRSTAPTPPSSIAKTEDALLDLVANHSGTRTGLVTPQLAMWLLTLNTGNRKVIADNVNRFKRVLQEGRWLNTGEPIIVSDEGILNDGQHRLLAIKETGIGAEVDIRFGVKRTAFKATGTGKRRSSGQVLEIEGYSNTTCQASIARLIIAYDTRRLGAMRHSGIDAAEILAMVDADDRIPEIAARIQRFKFSPLRTGSFGFVLAIACRVADPAKVFEFADLVASGLVADDSNPARRLHLRLRDAAMRGEKRDQISLALLSAKAWNAWIQGQSIQAFRVSEADRTSEGFPAIRGADVAGLAT